MEAARTFSTDAFGQPLPTRTSRINLMANSDRPAEDKSLGEQLVQGSDHSMGKKVPGGPFATVALSYLIILIIVSFAIAMVVYMFR